eukprot:TRINITY_DN11154_c0_g1_i3.p1 TRINITY_DN11154_c0_g1~~TRINITY_DN11154_c0_g1_i3.p1  ORF type:complete len:478 (+),score=66.96 TRINITY_DN11154_c0_g1_i3:97-1434(+)
MAQTSSATEHHHAPDLQVPGVPRYVVYLCALIMFINYCDRVNISVAILKMKEDLGWDKIHEGHVLGAFFIGYLTSQLLGSMLAIRYGARRLLAISAFGWSLLTLLTPEASHSDVIILCRIVLGVFEGMCFPCVFSILSESKPDRRSGNISLQISATYFATVFTLVTSEHMIIYYPWPVVFRVFGSIGFVWLVLWALTAMKHDEMAHLRAATHQASRSPRQQLKIALKLLQHPSTFPIFVGHFAHAFCHFLALSWLPTYYEEVDKESFEDAHRSHAMQLMAPYIIMTSCSMLGGQVADYAIRSGVDKSYVRRLAEAFGYGIGATAMSLFMLVEPGFVASALLSISIGSSGFATSGHEAAKLDVAPPEYVGLLQGVSNTLAALSGVLGVPIAAYINKAFNSWKAVFALVGLVYGVAGFIFYRQGTAVQIPRSELAAGEKQLRPAVTL